MSERPLHTLSPSMSSSSLSLDSPGDLGQATHASEHTLLLIKELRSAKDRGHDIELLATQNVVRIQNFLDEPFKHVGEAQENVLRRLRLRDVTLADGWTANPLTDQPSTADPQRALAAEAMHRANAVHKGLGPRSRFSDGDGSFWDRWLNDHGVLDGDTYFPPSRPLRPGFLPPMQGQGFKEGLCQLPDELESEMMEAAEPRVSDEMMERMVRVYDTSRELCSNSSNGLNKRGAFSDAVFGNHYLSGKRASSAEYENHPETRQAVEILDRASKKLGSSSSTEVEMQLGLQGVLSTNLTEVVGAAMGTCIVKCRAQISVTHLDATGCDSPQLFEIVSACGNALQWLDLTRVLVLTSPLPVNNAKLEALARALATTANLKKICLAESSMDDDAAARCFAALRLSKGLDSLDVSRNELGTGSKQRVAGRYFRAKNAGPLGAVLDCDSKNNLGSSSLTWLDCSANLVGPLAVAGIARSLATHPSLLTLKIASNPLGDAGMAWLARGIGKSCTLQELDVSSTGITAVGALTLAHAVRTSSSLTLLICRGNAQLGALGASALFSLQLYSSNRAIKVQLRASETERAMQDHIRLDWLHRVYLPVTHGRAPPGKLLFNLEVQSERALAAQVLQTAAQDHYSGGLLSTQAIDARLTVEEHQDEFDGSTIPSQTRFIRLRRELVEKEMGSPLLKQAEAIELSTRRELGLGDNNGLLDLADVEELLRGIHPDLGFAESQRLILECDWEGFGTVERLRAVRYALVLAAEIRRSRFEPKWTEHSAMSFGSINPQSLEWTLPDKGTLELNIELRPGPARWVGAPSGKAFEAIIGLAEDLGSTMQALKLAREARVEMTLQDAAQCCLRLLDAQIEERAGHTVELIPVLAEVAGMVGPSTRRARALRDALLGRHLDEERDETTGQTTADRRAALRRHVGGNRYRALFGPRPGAYVLNLSRESDREALRLLVRDDLTCADPSWEASQAKSGSRFRNLRLDDKPREWLGLDEGRLLQTEPLPKKQQHRQEDDSIEEEEPEEEPTDEDELGKVPEDEDEEDEEQEKAREEEEEEAKEVVARFHEVLEKRRGRPATPQVLMLLGERFCEGEGKPSAADCRKVLGARRSGLVAFDYAPMPVRLLEEEWRTETARLARFVAVCGWLGPRARNAEAFQADVDHLKGARQRRSLERCASVAYATLLAWRAESPLVEPPLEVIPGRRRKGHDVEEEHVNEVLSWPAAHKEAAAATEAVRRRRAKRISTSSAEAAVAGSAGAAFLSRRPDRSLEQALELVASLPSLAPEQACALLLWCPLTNEGGRPSIPPHLTADGDITEDEDDADLKWAGFIDECNGRRVALAVAMMDRLCASTGAMLLSVLSAPERGELLHRCGSVHCFDACNPEGFYVLDLALRDDRAIATALTSLQAAASSSEQPETLIQPFQTNLSEVTSITAELPTEGLLALRFTNGSTTATGELKRAASRATAFLPPRDDDDEHL